MSGAATLADAMDAMRLFAADPTGLGGIVIRAGPGPVRDRFLGLLYDALPLGTTVWRVPLHVGDDRLLGGIDLAATVQAGRPIMQKGLLAEADGGIVVLAMAERIDPATTSRLCAAMDDRTVTLQRDGLSAALPARFGVVALDEGAAPNERPPAPLLDRIAFHVDLTGVSMADIAPVSSAPRGRHGPAGRGNPVRHSAAIVGPDKPVHDDEGHEPGSMAVAITLTFSKSPILTPSSPDLIQGPAQTLAISESSQTISGGRAITARPVHPETPERPLPAEILCNVAAAFGISSLRAPILALRTARIAAGSSPITDADLALAARLVLAHRATCMPPPEETREEADTQTEPPNQTESDEQPPPGQTLEDIVLDAVKAALPPDLIARLAAAGGGRGLARTPGRAGQFKASNKRGRPIGIRPGDPKNGARLHLLETLKAAAPWQKLRGRTDRFQVRRDDFRIIRFRQRIGTTTVFAVDASGSAALHRLAEAKGAVELLLADCYVRRDQVALIAFRGHGATLLLPPTGSLLRAKRSLAGLPGGGSTPLAAGIEAAMTLADTVRRDGRTPVITLLTDACANIARDGTGGRSRAEAEALEVARSVRSAGFASLLVDTSPRPNPFARRLAEVMDARYLPLPFADASALSGAVRSASIA